MAHATATYADAGTAHFTGHYGPGTLGILLARPAGTSSTGSDVATTCAKCGQPIRYGAEAFMRLGGDKGGTAAVILCQRCGGGDRR